MLLKDELKHGKSIEEKTKSKRVKFNPIEFQHLAHHLRMLIVVYAFNKGANIRSTLLQER